jgi:predicted ArsR family transcriptional regulator
VTRRTLRRRYAILGLIMENGDASVNTIAKVLRYHHTDVLTELVLLEKQGRVVSELGMHVDGGASRRFYRLPTDAERATRGAR